MPEIVSATTEPLLPFSGRGALRDGWRVLQANFSELFFGHLLMVVLVMAGMMCCFIPGLLALGALWVGYARMALLAARGERISLNDLFWAFEKLFLQSLLLGLIVTAVTSALGTLLPLPFMLLPLLTLGADQTVMLVVASFSAAMIILLALLPTVAAVFLYSPATFRLVDKGEEAWPAMEASRQRVWANRKSWASFWGWVSLLHLAALLTCGLGLFVVNPLTMTALACAYERERGAAAGG